MNLLYCKLSTISSRLFIFVPMDMFWDGCKVTKRMLYLNKKKFHGSDIGPRCVVVNPIEKFNGNIQLPHAINGAEKLSEDLWALIKSDMG